MDHDAGVVHVAEAPHAGLNVLDDAVQAFEDRVGVPGHMEPVDDLGRVGQVVADALGESQAHVARHQAHAVRTAVARHEIVREPFDGMRIPARRHINHVALRQAGGHGDATVPSTTIASTPVRSPRIGVPRPRNGG